MDGGDGAWLCAVGHLAVGTSQEGGQMQRRGVDIRQSATAGVWAGLRAEAARTRGGNSQCEQPSSVTIKGHPTPFGARWPYRQALFRQKREVQPHTPNSATHVPHRGARGGDLRHQGVGLASIFPAGTTCAPPRCWGQRAEYSSGSFALSLHSAR